MTYITPHDNIRGPFVSINQGAAVGTSATVDGTGFEWLDEDFIRAVIQAGTVSAGGATAWLEFSDDDITYVALDVLIGRPANTFDVTWANADDNVVRLIEVDTGMIPATFKHVRVSVANGDGAIATTASAYLEFHGIKNTQYKDRTPVNIGVFLDGTYEYTAVATVV